MSHKDDALGDRLPQSGDPLRWGVFAAMVIFGMMTIVMGMATQEAGWNWKYISYAVSRNIVYDT